MISNIKNFFLMCSGANHKILFDPACEIERNKYAGIGATIFFTATLAFLSGSYAIFTVFDSIPVAISTGVLWCLIIFNLDRYIVSTMKKEYVPKDAPGEQHRKAKWDEFTHALPRLCLAIFISVLITRPLELRLFEGEILSRVQNTISEEIKKAGALVRGESSAIDDLKGESERLKEEIRNKEGEVHERHELAMKEAMGSKDSSTSGKKGKGPLFEERWQEYERANAELNTLRSTNAAKITAKDLEIDRLNGELNKRLGQTTATKQGANGLLARLQGLSDLASENWQVKLASLFLWVLFILLETSPIFVKLMSKRGPYDDLYDAKEYETFAAEHKRIAEIEDRTYTELMATRRQNEAWLEQQRQLIDAQLQLDTLTMGSLQTIVSEDIDAARVELGKLVVKQWRESQIARLRRQAASPHNGNARDQAVNQAPEMNIFAQEVPPFTA